MSDPDVPDWGRVIEKHADRVFRIAYRILGSVHDAEDVSQEVFTEAMAVHQSGPVRTWTGLMVRLATVRSIDRLRRDRGRPEPLPSVDVVSSAQQPDQQLIATELATWLRAAIRSLPDQQAAVFSLAYFEQLSRNEIATALDVSPETVSTTLYKARNKLSSQLAVVQGDHS
ncbi:RNA polymerase sigma factor [Rubripirellula reticaptiva]|uniref:ECF RNA polymerase sigma factor SigE n=1 Tax=Rubripirellula reticaptiva TaxID=2528013 RepID=A0A5C6FC37_9BACT|nr:sigma-70 family RNA polymerase sigma factor [Rubripirellula reticaptiva]TWU57864.1 ECF RNA polymerase sigma factor SigE [Rubripirellula reticaptiva]